MRREVIGVALMAGAFAVLALAGYVIWRPRAAAAAGAFAAVTALWLGGCGAPHCGAGSPSARPC